MGNKFEVYEWNINKYKMGSKTYFGDELIYTGKSLIKAI